MKDLGTAQQRGLDVMCPGFAADCLETLEEINEENRRYYEDHGGRDYHYIPALNDDDAHIELMADLVINNIGGWIVI